MIKLGNQFEISEPTNNVLEIYNLKNNQTIVFTKHEAQEIKKELVKAAREAAKTGSSLLAAFILIIEPFFKR